MITNNRIGIGSALGGIDKRPEGKPVFRTMLLVATALVLTGCINPNTGLREEQKLASSWVRPLDPQESIGAKEHPAVIAKYGGLYEDERAERMIAVIVGRLVAVSEDPSRVYKVNILNSPSVNAFALPGGFLYVTRGLLALANDSSELAAVLAHEMAHVTANHAIVRQEKLSSAKFGEQIVSEVLQDSEAGKIAVAANRLRLVDFSQDQELQADTIGIRMIGRAGYDAFAAARFLETMASYRELLSGSPGFRAAGFNSTHPSTPRRIEIARRHARFFGGPETGEKARTRYLQGVDGLLYGDTASEGFVRGRVFSHAGLGIQFEAPADFRVENQPKAVLVSGPDDIATRFDATVISKLTSLTDYLKSGWISGLVEETIREETLNGRPSATANAVGNGWRFKVRVIQIDNQLFRFITAAPDSNPNLDAVSRQVTGSFKQLTKAEIAALKPLRVKLVTGRKGNTIDSLARQMQGTEQKQALFMLINGLKPGDSVRPGQRYKIISE